MNLWDYILSFTAWKEWDTKYIEIVAAISVLLSSVFLQGTSLVKNPSLCVPHVSPILQQKSNEAAMYDSKKKNSQRHCCRVSVFMALLETRDIDL